MEEEKIVMLHSIVKVKVNLLKENKERSRKPKEERDDQSLDGPNRKSTKASHIGRKKLKLETRTQKANRNRKAIVKTSERKECHITLKARKNLNVQLKQSFQSVQFPRSKKLSGFS